MSEERIPVETFEEDYRCDKCGDGYMRPTGTALLSDPALYTHKCNNDLCWEVSNFRVTYPRQRSIVLRSASTSTRYKSSRPVSIQKKARRMPITVAETGLQGAVKSKTGLVKKNEETRVEIRRNEEETG